MARFLALHPRTIDLSLGRIERLLAALGHPEHGARMQGQEARHQGVGGFHRGVPRGLPSGPPPVRRLPRPPHRRRAGWKTPRNTPMESSDALMARFLALHPRRGVPRGLPSGPPPVRRAREGIIRRPGERTARPRSCRPLARSSYDPLPRPPHRRRAGWKTPRNTPMECGSPAAAAAPGGPAPRAGARSVRATNRWCADAGRGTPRWNPPTP
jgi:hypothetical protein